MKCPECQFDNREGAKYCKKCGAQLELICPKCNALLSPDSLFCDECGSKLSHSERAPTELSFDEKLTKIQKYLPKGLTEKILSQKDRIEGERKQVTVMFCDMQGFTPLSEMLGTEDAYLIMDQVYEILIHKVHDYEGTVNEMTGDGILALFGAPVALEDAPQRAIRSSLAIHREMAKFSDQLRQENKDALPVKMRIGVHTGPVVVGTVGNDLRVEFKAVGDTVNLASRMEGQAQPGTTYITEDTFNLTEGLFRFEGLGRRMIKGKKTPIHIYRVLAPSTRRTRFDVSAERGLTPFVGRQRELELLLDGFERAKSGRGQAFSIMGEAGVGKSRLLYEFRKAIADEVADPFSKAFALVCLALVERFRRDGQDAYDHADAAVILSTEKGFPLWLAAGTLVRGWALTALGQREEGMIQLRQGVADWRAIRTELFVPHYLADLAEGYGAIQQVDEALAALKEGWEAMERTGEHWWKAELHRLKGEVLLHQSTSDVAESANCFRQALEVARNQQAKSLELRAATRLARLWLSRDKRQEAYDLLAPVHDWFTEGFDTADLQEAKALLRELEK